MSFDHNDKGLRTIKETSKCSDGKGLGTEGEIIQIKSYIEEFGFVLVSEIDPEIVSIETLDAVC